MIIYNAHNFRGKLDAKSSKRQLQNTLSRVFQHAGVNIDGSRTEVI